MDYFRKKTIITSKKTEDEIVFEISEKQRVEQEKERRRLEEEFNKRERRKELEKLGVVKRCRACGIDKLSDDFPYQKDTPDFLGSYCYDCKRAKEKERYYKIKARGY